MNHRKTTSHGLAITGLGMVSSVGHDVVTACSSIRCGISRPSNLDGVSAYDPDELDHVPVVGHPLTGLVDGYAGIGLLTRLSKLAIADLIKYAGMDQEDSGFWSSTGLAICVSKIRRSEIDFFDEIIKQELPKKILEATDLSIAPNRCFVVNIGHAGVLQAIERATELIQKRFAKRFLVLGVDSLTGADDCDWYASQSRLKSTEQPAGLQPGEAGAVLLIEEANVARSRGAKVESYLVKTAKHREKHPRLGKEPPTGDAIASVVCACAVGMRKIQTMYGDLNGENARAMEWGSAVPQIRSLIDMGDARLILPAESIGDTGAASGAVSICAAVRSFVRKYAESNDIIIWSSSDTGEVAAARICSA